MRTPWAVRQAQEESTIIFPIICECNQEATPPIGAALLLAVGPKIKRKLVLVAPQNETVAAAPAFLLYINCQ